MLQTVFVLSLVVFVWLGCHLVRTDAERQSIRIGTGYLPVRDAVKEICGGDYIWLGTNSSLLSSRHLKKTSIIQTTPEPLLKFWERCSVWSKQGNRIPMECQESGKTACYPIWQRPPQWAGSVTENSNTSGEQTQRCCTSKETSSQDVMDWVCPVVMNLPEKDTPRNREKCF